MRQKYHQKNSIFVILMTALFLVCFLAIVVIGAIAYRNSVKIRQQNSSERIISAYLTAAVREGDFPGGVEVQQAENTEVLIVKSEDTDFVHRFYLSDGMLVEDYEKIDAPLNPNDVTEIGETSLFHVEESGDGTWLIETDAGRSVVKMRSAQ